MTAPTGECHCCGRDVIGYYVCGDCYDAHGPRVSRDCPVFAVAEAAAAARVAALPPSKPVVVSKEMHNRVMGLDR